MKLALSREMYLELVGREFPEAARVLDHLFDMIDGRTGIWVHEGNKKTVSIRLGLRGKGYAFTVAMFHLLWPNYRDPGKGGGDIWFGREIRTNSESLEEVEDRVSSQWCQALDDAGIGKEAVYDCHWGRALSYAEVVEHWELIEDLLRDLIDGLAGG